jgi:hypothetical protein
MLRISARKKALHLVRKRTEPVEKFRGDAFEFLVGTDGCDLLVDLHLLFGFFDIAVGNISRILQSR